MIVEPGFLIIGVQEQPDVVLRTLRVAVRIRDNLATLAGSGYQSSKILLCHGAALASPEVLSTESSWDQVLQFCSNERLTFVLDPQRHLSSSRSVTTLLRYALASAKPFSQEAYLVLSADSTISLLSGIPEERFAHAVKTFLSNASLHLGVFQNRNLLLLRAATAGGLQFPSVLLENSFANLVSSTRLLARKLNPSSIGDISFEAPEGLHAKSIPANPQGVISRQSQTEATAPPAHADIIKEFRPALEDGLGRMLGFTSGILGDSLHGHESQFAALSVSMTAQAIMNKHGVSKREAADIIRAMGVIPSSVVDLALQNFDLQSGPTKPSSRQRKWWQFWR